MREVLEYVFPAYAGMNRSPAETRFGGFRVPRIRGDEPAIGQDEIVQLPCSPHTRG